MKTKKAKRPRDVHAFVDTNIFLDFYRLSTPSNLTLLNKLNTVRERIISTYQVEMEFLKNRQRVIIDSYKKKDFQLNIQLPAVLQGTNAAAGMAKRGQGLSHGANNISK